MLIKLKWQLPGEPLAARYNWCQVPVPGRGPEVEKHCSKRPFVVPVIRVCDFRWPANGPFSSSVSLARICHSCCVWRLLSVLILLAHFRIWLIYTQKVDAVYSSDMLVSIYGTTQRHVPEYHDVNVHFRPNTNLRSWCDVCMKRQAALVYRRQ